MFATLPTEMLLLAFLLGVVVYLLVRHNKGMSNITKAQGSYAELD